MRNILAIAGKDVRIYLTTRTGYLLFGFFLLVTAFFFNGIVEEYQRASLQAMRQQNQWLLDQLNLTDMVMGNVLQNVSVFFLFVLPILTMRLFADERRGKTLELLMTAPVRPYEIVLGKYLSALVMVALLLALTFVFPILLTIYGGTADGSQSALDWGTVWVAYLGMFLLGAAFVSVGTFASSVTDSPAVAAVIGFFVLLLFFVIGFAGRGEEGFWNQFLGYLSITNHLEDFLRGVIKVQAVVYYVSLATLGLFLTYRVVEAQRWR